MTCPRWQWRWAEQFRNGIGRGPDAVRFTAHFIYRQQAAFTFPVGKRAELNWPVFLFAHAHEPSIRHSQTYRERAPLSSRAQVACHAVALREGREGSRRVTLKVSLPGALDFRSG